MAKAKRPQPLARPNLVTRLRAYGRDHLRGIVFSLGKLYRQPLATTLTLLMVAVALALPACLFVLLNNLQSVTQDWDNSGQITLFLASNTSTDAINKLQTQVEDLPEIESVKYITPEQALEEFRGRSEFGQLLDGLQDNPLPPTLILTPTTDAKQAGKLDQLVKKFRSYSNVEYVQLDMEWLQRLQAISDIVRRAITILGIMLAASVLLVIGNSIRLDIENRRQEIEVTKLIGATDGFIRRPFLYGGIWYGLLGGIMALIFVLTVLLIIKRPTHELVSLYNSGFKLIFPSLKQCIGLIAMSIALGLAGSWLAVGRHIARIEPS